MEYYHIYNRGAHKAPIFLDGNDYARFLYLLYIKNNTDLVRMREFMLINIFSIERSRTLVDIVAYCLMPNHFHIAIREKTKNKTSSFIHRLCTSYTMYYNNKYNHSGTIFQGPYNKKHVGTDDYLRYLIQYIHLNPYGIKEPEMNRLAKSEYLDKAIEYSKTYEYSSFKDYLGENRPQRSILELEPGEA